MFLAVRCTITGRFRVCHNKRITRNKMFRDYAERGKSTMGWCFGFKLHLICNERGELLNFIPNRSLGLLFAVQHIEILMTDLGLYVCRLELTIRQ